MITISLKDQKGKDSQKQLFKQFNILLQENDLTLRRFCFKNDLDYFLIYGKLKCINRVHLDLDFLQDLVNKIDKTKKVHERNGKYVIAKPF